MRRLETALLSVTALLLLPGCESGPTCPPGTRITGSTCQPLETEAGSTRDAGIDGALSPDGSIDAPPDAPGPDGSEDARAPVDARTPADAPAVDAARARDAAVDAGPDGGEGVGDACARRTFYRDRDGDGFGDPDAPVEACERPSGHAADGDDCDDDCTGCNPDGTEGCDGRDNDCDGDIDEANAVDAGTWYRDMDGDDFGDPDVTVRACDPPAGYVDNDEDCHDDAELANPNGTWHADAIPGHPGDYDYNCDGDEERRWTYESIGECFGMTACYQYEGWIDGVPGCGQGGEWRQCSSHPTAGCGELPPLDRDQQCR